MQRPSNDRFSGADDSIAFDTIVHNKRLQIGTVHNLGSNFSKLYNLQYLDNN